MKRSIAFALLFLSLAGVVSLTAQTNEKRIERFKKIWQDPKNVKRGLTRFVLANGQRTLRCRSIAVTSRRKATTTC